LDWHHPDYFPRGRTGQHSGRVEHGEFANYLDFMDSQLAELCGGDYGKIAGIWFDGWWDQRVGGPAAAPTDTQVDWRLEQTYDLIHRLQPQALIGNNHHVTPFSGEDFQMFERDLPGQNQAGHSADATISQLPLETCDTINGAWGYNAKDDQFKSVDQLIHYLVRAAGHNANLLLNVGPMPDGRIQPECVERLRAMGQWTGKYGQSIYGTRGGPVSPREWGASTRRGSTVYLHVLQTAGPRVTLTGTADFQYGTARYFDGQAVRLERNQQGELVVPVPEPLQGQPDMIIVLERFQD
jgi:alpha-L-fucosidase